MRKRKTMFAQLKVDESNNIDSHSKKYVVLDKFPFLDNRIRSSKKKNINKNNIKIRVQRQIIVAEIECIPKFK